MLQETGTLSSFKQLSKEWVGSGINCAVTKFDSSVCDAVGAGWTIETLLMYDSALIHLCERMSGMEALLDGSRHSIRFTKS